MNQNIKIGSRYVGSGQPCYVIAEMSANHNHNIERAEAIIRAAAEAGANAVKLQTYTADTLTIPCDNEYFRVKGTIWEGKTLHDLYQEANTPWEWHDQLMKLANEFGLDCFSTPFDNTSVDFLSQLNVPCYKVASFELVDIPLLKKIAATGKPVIMSTGMASLSEIEEAVFTLKNAGSGEIILLKCTSAYPAPPEESNLLTIPHLSSAFGCPTGLSDHTMGSAVAIAAVTLGACVIEKHFTLLRADGGPDGSFSMEPHEFKQMVADIRTAEKAIGRVCYELTDKQKESIVFRRSLFVVNAISAGESFTPENVRSIRPGYGLHTRHLPKILGRKATRSIVKGEPLDWGMIK